VKSCRILIADDHELVRRGVRTLLEAHPGWEVCGEALTGREAVEKARASNPDVVVMDISMPELNGLEATRQIVKVLPKTEVLVLTVHESEQVEQEVLAAGARGYILKSDDGRDLVTAIEQLRRHRPFFTAKVTRMVLDNYIHNRAPGAGPGLGPSLTSREREVAQLLAEGKGNKEVATLLGISLRTVECHRSNLLRKLGLHNLTELVHYAIRNKMVEP